MTAAKHKHDAAARRRHQYMRSALLWLRQRHLWWLRYPLAALLIAGGFLGFLPVLGFWMIPLGLVLLFEDIPGIKWPVLRLWARLRRIGKGARKSAKRR